MKIIEKLKVNKLNRKNERKRFSILMLLFFTITNIIPQYVLADSNNNNNILGDIEHYNAVIFGDFTPWAAETEGALAIQGDLKVEDRYTVGGVNGAPTGWSVGEGKIDNNGPTFALGGDILQNSKIPNIGSKTNRPNDVVATDGSNVIKQLPNWMSIKSISKSDFLSQFKKLRQQVNDVMDKASHFTPDTANSIQSSSEPFKFVKSKENGAVIVNSQDRNVMQLDINKDFDIPNLDNTKFLIIYSKAEVVNFSKNLTYEGKSVDDTKHYSETPADTPIKKIAPKILYVFPNAKTINVTSGDGIRGNIFAPDATLTISGITLNGQMFLKNAIQKGGTEFHNFVMNWTGWKALPDPTPIQSKGSIKLIKKADNNDTLLPNAVFQLKDSKQTVIKNTESKDGNYNTDSNGEINIPNLVLGNYTLTEITAPDGYENSNQVISFDINEANKDVTKVAINKKIKTASVKLTKIDKDSKAPLQGVRFEFHKDDGVNGDEGTLVEENLISGPDGVVKTKAVPLGKYYLKEVSTLDGYTLLNNRITVDLSNDKDGDVSDLGDIVNEKTKVKVQIKKVDSVSATTTLSGAVFKLFDDNTKKEVTQNKTYTTDSNGLSEEITLTKGSYYFEEITPPKGYKTSNNKITFNITGKETDKVVQTVSNVKEAEKLGSLRITKTGNVSEEKLEGVKFDLLDSDTNNAKVIDTLTTDRDGIATKDNLPIGKYYLKEIKTKLGYKLNSEFIEVNITEDNLNVEKNLVNKVILKSAQITKVDKMTGAKLQGATFKLVHEDKTESGEYKSDEHGIATATGLKPGKYSFLETKAPEGYKLDQTPIPFEIKLDSESVVDAKTLENELIKGSVTVTKVDKDNKDIKLDGAQLKLFKANDEQFSTDIYTTKDGGKITISDLPLGSYYFKETKAPDKYELDDSTKWDFKIEKADDYSAKAIEINIENTKSKTASIKIIKTDEDNSNLKLDNVKFSLYKESSNVNEKAQLISNNITTDNNGEALCNNLKLGKYYLIEDQAKAGYIKNNEKISFELNDSDVDKVKELSIKNKKAQVKVQIKKIDAKDTNKTLNGAEFKLFKANNEEVVKDKIYKIDQNGLSEEITLTNGTYYFEEVKAPDGYKLGGRQSVFTITGEEKETVIQTISNVKEDVKTGSLTITKKGNLKDELLDGVEFDLLDSTEKNVIAHLTTVNGIAEKCDLPIGKYYLKETKTKEGYELNTNSEEVEISETSLNIEKILTNKVMLRTVEFKKVDKDTKTALKGAKFKVVPEDKTEAESGEYVSKENGIVTINALKPGKYNLIETQAPNGYKLDQTPIKFEVGFGDKDTIIDNGIITNVQDLEYKITLKADPEVIIGDGTSQSKLTATVTDKNNKPVSNVNVVFEVPNGKLPNGTKKDSSTTNKDGVAEIKYTAEDLTGKEDNQKVTITATAEDKEKGLNASAKITLTVEPPSIAGVVTEDKVEKDKDNKDVRIKKTVANAIVEIYDKDNKKVGSAITGPNGDYKIKVPDSKAKYEVRITTTIDVDGEKRTVKSIEEVVVGKTSGEGKEIFNPEKSAVGIIALKPSSKDDKKIFFDDYSNFKIEPIIVDGKTITGTISNDSDSKGVFTIKGLEKDKEYKTDVKYKFPNGLEIKVGCINIKIEHDGELNLSQTLIDPYGIITDSKTGKIIEGAHVELHYANSDGSVGTLVKLPLVKDFQPADNANPQSSDKNGSYAYMVYPHTDYYVTATKDGYNDYKSPIIKVGEDIVKHDFKMDPKESTSGSGGGGGTSTNPIPDPVKGAIELTKIDENGNPITSDTTKFKLFKVVNNESNLVGEFETNQYGKIQKDDLEVGSYRLEETKAPDGYDINTTQDASKFKFEVTNNNTKTNPVKISIINNKKILGQAKLIKTDETGTPLKGAKFNVIIANTRIVVLKDIESGDDGSLLAKGLKPGSYQFVEVEAPKGYVRSFMASKSFVIPENPSVNPVDVGTFKNEKKKGSVLLRKIDEDGNLITTDSAQFKLYKEDGITEVEKDRIYSTKVDGTLQIDTLPIGRYKFVEVKAPNGYDLGSNSNLTFEIKEDNFAGSPQIINVINKVRLGSAKILKVNEKDEPLAGAKFAVIKQGTSEVLKGYECIESDKDGVIIANGLKPGFYLFVEIEAPKGYIKDTTPIPFEIKLGQQTLTPDRFEATFKNKLEGIENKPEVKPENPIALGKIGDTVWLDKNKNGVQDKDEVGVQNVKVTLYTVDGSKIAETLTNVSGKYLFDNVPIGDYRVKFDLPKGYNFTMRGYLAVDSDSDAYSNGYTDIIRINKDNLVRLTVDAGIVLFDEQTIDTNKNLKISSILVKTGGVFGANQLLLLGMLSALLGVVVIRRKK